jgi:hypothetical protein
MNNPEKEKLDILLKRNADEQLARVDWQKFDASISSRLDMVSQHRTFKLPKPLEIAAMIAVACVIAAGILITHYKQTITPARAWVELIPANTRTAVQILDPYSQSELIFSAPSANSSMAKCEIEIIEPAEQTNQNFGGPTWFIICKQETSASKNGMSEETASLLCLF